MKTLKRNKKTIKRCQTGGSFSFKNRIVDNVMSVLKSMDYFYNSTRVPTAVVKLVPDLKDRLGTVVEKLKNGVPVEDEIFSLVARLRSVKSWLEERGMNRSHVDWVALTSWIRMLEDALEAITKGGGVHPYFLDQDVEPQDRVQGNVLESLVEPVKQRVPRGFGKVRLDEDDGWIKLNQFAGAEDLGEYLQRMTTVVGELENEIPGQGRDSVGALKRLLYTINLSLDEFGPEEVADMLMAIRMGLKVLALQDMPDRAARTLEVLQAMVANALRNVQLAGLQSEAGASRTVQFGGKEYSELKNVRDRIEAMTKKNEK
jgi:hypothetical protein